MAAAEFIRDMTDYTKKKSENAVFTVGKLTAKPGLSNVIAGSAQLSVDLRDGVDGALDDIEGELHKRALKLEQDGFGVELIKCCREETGQIFPRHRGGGGGVRQGAGAFLHKNEQRRRT